jgi:hypothetical protein
MKSGSYIFLLFVLVSCKNNRSSCNANMDNFLMNDKVFMPGPNSFQLIDKGKDSIIGGAYFFYNNKELQSYKFFGSKKAYTYSEEFDVKGALIKRIGKPIVYKNIRELNKDSILITYYLFAYNKIYFKPGVSINDSSKIDMELKEDTLYSNMLSASIGVNTAGLSLIKLYLDVECVSRCDMQAELLRDTMVLKKNPELEVQDQP